MRRIGRSDPCQGLRGWCRSQRFHQLFQSHIKGWFLGFGRHLRDFGIKWDRRPRLSVALIGLTIETLWSSEPFEAPHQRIFRAGVFTVRVTSSLPVCWTAARRGWT